MPKRIPEEAAPGGADDRRDALLESVAAAAVEADLFRGVERLIVGCSGGGDSVALLDILVCLRQRFGYEIGVAHLHHGWRGEEADGDLDHARRLAESMELPFFGERAELSEASGSREEVARRARLAFFERLVADWPADAVALGHTAEDQLETVMLNLVRGTGGRGLGGMQRRRRLGELLILRPLLEQRRAALRAYARARGMEWREDSSNLDISLARNRLRHKLLTELQQIHPGAVGNVARAARLAREEEQWLEGLARDAFEEVQAADPYPGGVALDVTRVRRLPTPLQRRVLRLAVREVRGDTVGITLEHVDAALYVVHGAPAGAGSARDLPGARVSRDGDRIRILPLAARRLRRP